MKTCSKCKLQKETSGFYRNTSAGDGLCTQCISCFQEYNKTETRKLIMYKSNHSPKTKLNKQKYSLSEKSRAAKQKYKHTTKGRVKQLSLTRKRQANKLNATPPWLTKDHLILMEMEYQKALYLTKVTGIKWHVDHIIPLQAKNVRGLHVPWNLRVIPAVENESRGNKI